MGAAREGRPLWPAPGRKGVTMILETMALAAIPLTLLALGWRVLPWSDHE